MYVSVRRYDNVVSVGRVCGKIAESFVPLLRKRPGFIAYYAVDGGGGTMATVSVFSTEAMAREVERGGGQVAEGERRRPAAGSADDPRRQGGGCSFGLRRNAPRRLKPSSPHCHGAPWTRGTSPRVTVKE